MIKGLKVAVFVLVLLLASQTANACDIVHGQKWSFMSKSPRDWSSACGPNAMLGTVTTLWPSGQVPSRANAIIYVTVRDSVLANFEAFAADEQAKFVDTTPGSSVAPVWKEHRPLPGFDESWFDTTTPPEIATNWWLTWKDRRPIT